MGTCPLTDTVNSCLTFDGTSMFQILEEELKSVIEKSGEDYTQHQQIINQLLQLQLKVRSILHLPSAMSPLVCCTI